MYRCIVLNRCRARVRVFIYACVHAHTHMHTHARAPLSGSATYCKSSGELVSGAPVGSLLLVASTKMPIKAAFMNLRKCFPPSLMPFVLIVAARAGWDVAYIACAAFALPAMLTALVLGEPARHVVIATHRGLRQAWESVAGPLLQLALRPEAPS